MSKANSHKLSGNIVTQLNNKHPAKQTSNSVTNQPLHLQSQQQQQSQIQSHFSIPPRYQPPPQPPGGILKNIPSSKTVSSGYPTITGDSQKVSTHINLKYPPEVPKLATVYIPDGVRTATSSKNSQSRSIINHRQNQHLSSTSSTTSSASSSSATTALVSTTASSSSTQLREPSSHHRLSLEEDQLNRLQAISLASGGQQNIPLDMLKFVRKSDSEASSAAATSSNNNNNNSNSTAVQARLLAEQNRHFQVSFLFNFFFC